MAATIQKLERHNLSDGGFVHINRFGHKYNVCRTYPDLFTPPDSAYDLTKAEAYELAADILRDDVCELV